LPLPLPSPLPLLLLLPVHFSCHPSPQAEDLLLPLLLSLFCSVVILSAAKNPRIPLGTPKLF
jgi:hypothetical protein